MAFYALRMLRPFVFYHGWVATTRFLEWFLEGSSKEVLLRRVPRRCLGSTKNP